jgi:hypothetical protein
MQLHQHHQMLLMLAVMLLPLFAGPAPSPATCEGDMVYTFTYTDCSGNSHVWTYTYTIDIPDFLLPADGASTVNCPADAVAPTPPNVVDCLWKCYTPVAGPAPSSCNLRR